MQKKDATVQSSVTLSPAETPKHSRILLTVAFGIIGIICALAIVLAIKMPARKAAKQDLFNALKNNDPRVVTKILDQYPDLVNEDYYAILVPIDASNSSPLIHAIKYGDLEMVNLLVEKGANVNKSTARSYPLHQALFLGKYDVAWYLINNGANVLAKSGKWKESVPFCILSQRITQDNADWEQAQYELMKYVLEHGAPLDPPSGSLEGIKTLLGLAVYQNNKLIAKYLLDKQICNVNEIVNPEYTKKTALIIATEKQSYELCQLLLNYGADITATDIDGNAAIDYAKALDNEQLLALLKNK